MLLVGAAPGNATSCFVILQYDARSGLNIDGVHQ